MLLFLQDHPKSLEEIRAAIARQDTQAVTFFANPLRGSLGNFSATPTMNAALQLVNLGRQGDLSTAQSALTQREESIARLKPLLASLVMGKLRETKFEHRRFGHFLTLRMLREKVPIFSDSSDSPPHEVIDL